MKKSIAKLLSLCLSVLMIGSLTQMPAAADEPQSTEEQMIYFGENDYEARAGYYDPQKTDFEKTYKLDKSSYLQRDQIPSYTETEDTLTFGDYEYKVNEDGNTVTIVKYNSRERNDLVIPETIDGKTVTVIGEQSFASKFMNTVVMPDTVEIMGEMAFADC